MRTVFGSTGARSLRAILTLVLSVAFLAVTQFTFTGDADAKKRKVYKSSKSVKKAKTTRKRVARKRATRKRVSRKRARIRKSYRKRRVARKRSSRRRTVRRVQPRANPRYAAYVIDAKTGKVLHARHANAKRYPASLTKMMTVYLMFEDLKSGKIKLSDRVVMTPAGARRPPSKIGLRVGQSISVEQALLSLVTKSANDVATAVGDKLSGSEAAFARRMTRKARQLGMNSTTFKNASGLTAQGQLTTASDMAKLGLALREHFPRRYRYFQTRVFKLGKRRYGNHNKLLGRVRGVDGIKTGYTRASGFNLVSSVSAGNRRIVAVVMGGRSGASRNAHMRQLISAYLPKASRGKSRRLIARATSSRTRVASREGLRGTVTASNKLPSVVPTPAFSPKAKRRIANRVRVAHAKSATSQKDVLKVKKAIIAMANSAKATPEARPAQRFDSASTAPRRTTASVREKPVQPGWHVQIAATDNRVKAYALLDRVKTRNRRLLNGTTMATPRVVKNGIILYRARFTGFTNKAHATRACRLLKKQKVSCLALRG